jgi:putative tryptophan/tyrosine transport system substrate-binding protein
MPVIGFLSAASPDLYAHLLRAFRQGLGEAGFVEGRNVAIEFRWAEGQTDRIPAFAADLVRRQVAVMAVGGVPAVQAAKAVTSTIPIVFSISANPVEIGLVASLNRPGGNVTGNTSMNVELGPKRLEVLRELVPTATVMAGPTTVTNRANLNLDNYLPYLVNRVGSALVASMIKDALTEHDLSIAMWRVLAVLSIRAAPDRSRRHDQHRYLHHVAVGDAPRPHGAGDAAAVRDLEPRGRD